MVELLAIFGLTPVTFIILVQGVSLVYLLRKIYQSFSNKTDMCDDCEYKNGDK